MSNNITITFPDGNTKEFDKGVDGLTIAKSISNSLAKESIAIKLNGEIVDLSISIGNDSDAQIIKKEDEIALDIIRHDCAHVMAEAVQYTFSQERK